MYKFYNKKPKPSFDPHQVIDLYLFINPFGFRCYCVEKEIQAFIKNAPCKVNIKILTYHNMNTITQYMKENQLDVNDIALRNKIYKSIYHLSIAFKMALQYGQKRGRQFLMRTQKMIHEEHQELTKDLLVQISKDLNMPITFDLPSDEYEELKKSYANDLKIACEMGITETPSLVMFDNFTDEYGILIQRDITQQHLIDLYNNYSDSSRTFTKNSPTKSTECVLAKTFKIIQSKKYDF
ncbi:DsbA family protein [Atopobacter phocae]|uniref:DsbA family protein n=1 Tax=Atopobacter phocae TaxID=136492 RepID=UPI00046EF87D|nr:DsbA family protein [Atopobacter phocae]